MLFSKPSKAIGIDIGTHSVKAIQMSKAGGRMRVDQAGYARIDPNKMNIDPLLAQAEALAEAIRNMPLPQSLVVGALPGQTVVIRYPRFAEMPLAELAVAVEKEAGQSIPYELSDVFLDWTVLDRVIEAGETKLKVLLVAAKHEVIDTRVQVAQTADVKFGILSVDSLALADAAECCDFLRVGETVALVNLGASTTSIHFIKDGMSNFIRDVNWGARELIQAIAKATRCDYVEAERQLLEFSADKNHPSEEAPLPSPENAYVAEAEPPPESAPVGGSMLDPFDDELDAMAEVPQKPPSPAAAPAAATGLADILATPLGRLVTEIRRSFDYYEHQLYEKPVDRLILSGGAAHLGLLRDTLREDLGMDQLELADPARSRLHFSNEREVARMQENSAPFMVALGLAARGMADL